MEAHGILLLAFHLIFLIHTGSSCTVQVDREMLFIPFREYGSLNCTSNDCTDRPTWESRFRKENIIEGAGFTSVDVNASDWDGAIIACQVDPDVGDLVRSQVTVMAYALPSRVTIQLEEELEEGKEHEVTCSAEGVAPVNYLTISLARGGEPFLNKSYSGDSAKEPEKRMTTFNFTAHRTDNLQDFACLATLNLPNVTNTTVWSPPVTVRTYALPNEPQITAETWMEKGTVAKIACDAHQVFPAENVTVQLSIDNNPVNISSTIGSDKVTATSTVDTSDLLPGEHNVTCTSQVFSYRKSSHNLIHIYEIPRVLFGLSANQAVLGDSVTANCTIMGVSAEYFHISIKCDGKSYDVTEEIIVNRRQPNLPISCEVFIKENGRVVTTSSQNLTVYYPPGPLHINVSENSPVRKGDSFNITCHSEAMPPPEYLWVVPPQAQVTYSADNSSITIREASPHHSGNYTCTATNRLGASPGFRNVEVQPETGSPPHWIIWIIIAAALVVMGVLGVSYYCYRKNGKKGFYNLLRRNPKSTEVPLPLKPSA
ncbi:intercellular adhesion molecule 1-like [Hyperolius riggenbachi]|uniref:intercellular adhesion molecule 1-like n=1 Tax=Hyperolius riggenbachi TaxID=752182 RepID=UPI0035A2D5E6